MMRPFEGTFFKMNNDFFVDFCSFFGRSLRYSKFPRLLAAFPSPITGPEASHLLLHTQIYCTIWVGYCSEAWLCPYFTVFCPSLDAIFAFVSTLPPTSHSPRPLFHFSLFFPNPLFRRPAHQRVFDTSEWIYLRFAFVLEMALIYNRICSHVHCMPSSASVFIASVYHCGMYNRNIFATGRGGEADHAEGRTRAVCAPSSIVRRRHNETVYLGTKNGDQLVATEMWNASITVMAANVWPSKERARIERNATRQLNITDRHRGNRFMNVSRSFCLRSRRKWIESANASRQSNLRRRMVFVCVCVSRMVYGWICSVFRYEPVLLLLLSILFGWLMADDRWR